MLDANVPHGRDAATGLPVWSLYGSERRPSRACWRAIDTLVFDIQDVGVRYYTYLTTLVYVMEEAARRGSRWWCSTGRIPITGPPCRGAADGPRTSRSFTAPHPIPVRTGMTIGEFARMVAAERKITVSLTVVPLEGWDRGPLVRRDGAALGEPVAQHPLAVTQALLYSGIGLLEATNLSVGRGTDMPFEVIGAPWIEPIRPRLPQASTRCGCPA